MELPMAPGREVGATLVVRHPAIEWQRHPIQPKRTRPAALRAEESADNSDDRVAVGWFSHERPRV